MATTLLYPRVSQAGNLGPGVAFNTSYYLLFPLSYLSTRPLPINPLLYHCFLLTVSIVVVLSLQRDDGSKGCIQLQ